jgi:hypothetical protein
VAEKVNTSEVKDFLKALGLEEEPMGMYYTDAEPEKGISPKSARLPTIEMEARGAVDWAALFGDFSCVIGKFWRARKKKIAAYFDKERFGCLGDAFYLGFLKPQLNFITHYVSTGIPNQVEGERYLESPEVTRKPVTQFVEDSQPELIVFFARTEVISGLNQLATFVTNDF